MAPKSPKTGTPMSPPKIPGLPAALVTPDHGLGFTFYEAPPSYPGSIPHPEGTFLDETIVYGSTPAGPAGGSLAGSPSVLVGGGTAPGSSPGASTGGTYATFRRECTSLIQQSVQEARVVIGNEVRVQLEEIRDLLNDFVAAAAPVDAATAPPLDDEESEEDVPLETVNSRFSSSLY